MAEIFMTKAENSGLSREVIRFAGFLKSRGFKVFQTGVQDAIRSLRAVSIENRDDFFFSLRATLSSSDLEWVQFQTLFDEFWHRIDGEDIIVDSPQPGAEKTDGEDGKHQDMPFEVKGEKTENKKNEGEKEWLEGVAYSSVSRVEQSDLGKFEKADIQVAQLLLKNMMEPFRLNLVRRSKRTHKKGNLDFPRTIRKSLKTGGTPLKLFFREKKKRLKRLVILADVSGSMDRYARFVMPFLLGLRGIGSKAEVFVFSTSLTPITFLIRHLNVDEALERVAKEVPEWSGGTRIGYSLHQFNQGAGLRLLTQRAVVVILSDGWDLGGKELLRREMAFLQSKAHSVIWLNPLAGDPDYAPICKGMNVAMPYIDHFLAADSLHSLKKAGSLLAKVVYH